MTSFYFDLPDFDLWPDLAALQALLDGQKERAAGMALIKRCNIGFLASSPAGVPVDRWLPAYRAGARFIREIGAVGPLAGVFVQMDPLGQPEQLDALERIVAEGHLASDLPLVGSVSFRGEVSDGVCARIEALAPANPANGLELDLLLWLGVHGAGPEMAAEVASLLRRTGIRELSYRTDPAVWALPDDELESWLLRLAAFERDLLEQGGEGVRVAGGRVLTTLRGHMRKLAGNVEAAEDLAAYLQQRLAGTFKEGQAVSQSGAPMLRQEPLGLVHVALDPAGGLEAYGRRVAVAHLRAASCPSCEYLAACAGSGWSEILLKRRGIADMAGYCPAGVRHLFDLVEGA